MAFDFAVLFKLSNDAFHDLAAFVDVSVFATSEQNCHLHLVVMLKEIDGLLDLEVDVVVTGFHDAAHGRFRFAGNFNEVQTEFSSFVECFLSWDHTKLLAILIDDADGSNTDLFVDPILILIDCWFLSKLKNDRCDRLKSRWLPARSLTNYANYELFCRNVNRKRADLMAESGH